MDSADDDPHPYPHREPATYAFTLFVAGATERSDAARSNLRALCASLLPGGYEITVIDVTEQPELAEDHHILATPTVIRRAPLPSRRVIGDLSDQRRAALALGLPEPGLPEPGEKSQQKGQGR
ncbi:circadian clock KaiB family protein [Streptomyces boninensis]|uniref:circadian clock KaiB family protein n=1 Tax=Streptomyces boninensis TaxID=2039455 RepID=UPI003B2206AD